MKGRIPYAFLPVPLALLHRRAMPHRLDSSCILTLGVAIREADETGELRLALDEWMRATGFGSHRQVGNVLGKLVSTGHLRLVRRGGPGVGPSVYSVAPVMALLAGDGGAAVVAARKANGDTGGEESSPREPPACGEESSPGCGEESSPPRSEETSPPPISRSERQGDGEMENKKTKREDGRPKTAAAGAPATAPPSQSEEQDEEDDDVESSNDGFGRREPREPPAPGGLRRLNRYVNHYLDLLRLHRGIATPVITGKDRGIFRHYLEGQPDDEVVAGVIEAFVLDNDGFVTNNGWPLWLLVRRHNAYAARVAGQAGCRPASDPSPSAERIRILRAEFSKAWAAKYGRPRVEPAGNSETKPALEVISHYEAAGGTEAFEAWAARIARAFLEMDDGYIVERAHPFHLLPFRIDRLLARRGASRRERGTNPDDWKSETCDAGETGHGGTVQ